MACPHHTLIRLNFYLDWDMICSTPYPDWALQSYWYLNWDAQCISLAIDVIAASSTAWFHNAHLLLVGVYRVVHEGKSGNNCKFRMWRCIQKGCQMNLEKEPLAHQQIIPAAHSVSINRASLKCIQTLSGLRWSHEHYVNAWKEEKLEHFNGYLRGPALCLRQNGTVGVKQKINAQVTTETLCECRGTSVTQTKPSSCHPRLKTSC